MERNSIADLPKARDIFEQVSTLEEPSHNDCIDESTLEFDDGILSISKSLAFCIRNINDVSVIPSIYNGSTKEPLKVETHLNVISIAGLDAVLGTVQLDFYMYFYWIDNRFSMKDFWSHMSDDLKETGVRFDQNSDQFDTIWKPDIFFHDGLSSEVQSELFTLNYKNEFTHSKRVVATFSQQQFTFADFPNDSQNISIRFGSYGYDERLLKLNWTNTRNSGDPSCKKSSVCYATNYDGARSFQQNSEW